MGKSDPSAILLAALPGLVWLVLFHFTDDRRLFFPFTIQYALQAGFFRRPALTGCGVIVGTFFAIRIAQGATLKVLIVEMIVTVAVIAISTSGYRQRSNGWLARLSWAAFGSFVAYLGLAF